VSKPALGRGLGNLLKDSNAPTAAEEKPATPEAPAAPQPPAPPTALTPGMASLLRGKQAERQPDATPADPQPTASERPTGDRKVLKGSLVAADMLLLTLTGYLVFNSHKPFGAVEVSLCIIAVGLGAWLTCLALWKS
jgi:hypothetical protein